MALPDIATVVSAAGGFFVCGRAVGVDLYALNGFRCLGLGSATTDGERLAAQQRFRSRFRLKPDMAIRAATEIGYSVPVWPADAATAVERLNDPVDQFVLGLFWPEQLRLAAEGRTSLTGVGPNDADGSGGRHARAIASHSAAIGQELAYLAKGRQPLTEVWVGALAEWRACLEDTGFWDRQATRIAQIGHPGLNPTDLGAIRSELPGAILNVNRAFAIAYARAGAKDDSVRHMSLIADHAKGGLSYGKLDSVLAEVLGALAELDLAKARPFLAELSSSLKLPYTKVNADLVDVWSALDAAAQNVTSYDGGRLRKARDGFASANSAALIEPQIGGAFDNICELIRQICQKAVDYQGKDRVRALQWSLVTQGRLLHYPIGPALAAKLRSCMADDLGFLYGPFYDRKDRVQLAALRADDCWFCPGQPADPAEAMIFPMHKVTHRDDRGISYLQSEVLVPRSAYAAAVHAGKKRAPVRNGTALRELEWQILEIQTSLKTEIAELEEIRDRRLREAEAAGKAELEAFDAGQSGKLSELSAPRDHARIEFYHLLPLLLKLDRSFAKRPIEYFLKLVWPVERDRFLSDLRATRQRAEELVKQGASEAAEAIRKAFSAKLAEFSSRFRAAMLREAQSAFDKAGAALEAVAKERNAIVARREAAVVAIRTESEADIRERKTRVDGRISQLKQKITPPAPRPRDHGRQFPVHLAAKRNGFRDGAEP